jgi:hypothetical protein
MTRKHLKTAVVALLALAALLQAVPTHAAGLHSDPVPDPPRPAATHTLASSGTHGLGFVRNPHALPASLPHFHDKANILPVAADLSSY